MSSNFDEFPLPTRPPSNPDSFDEVPIGNGAKKFAISEFAQGQIQQAPQSAANLTMEQKLQSKTVKVKLEGLEELREGLGDAGRSGEIQIQLAKILKENNPACLEKALLCAQKWMEIGKAWGEKQIKEIVDNGYVNGKGATKKLATDLIYKAFETRPEEVQRTIVQIGFKGKVPKVVGGYLALLNELLQQFGIKDLKYLKPYIPTIVQVMNNEKLPVVKSQGMNVFKNGLKWLGKDFLWPMFSELKDNMKKELESFWEGHDKKEVMKANRQKSGQSAVGKSEGALKVKGKQIMKSQPESMQSGGLDIYQISDPIDVLSKFDQRWTENVLEAQKWNAKTALLQEITTKLNIPKIANGQHRHITEMIRRLINDSNFNVVLAVMKLSGVLAKGLRKNFSHSAKLLFPYITPKFRDKKTQMIEETYSTLNNFCYCFSLEQVSEDIKTALKDKAAGMKNNIIKWMTSSIEQRKGESGSDRVVEFFKSSAIQGIVEGLLNDPSADVRDSTAKLVCKVRALYGQSLFKNVDKSISNKDILQKLSENPDEQPLSKSRTKQTSTKKSKSQSKGKSSKKQQEQLEQTSKNTYTLKLKNADTIDITDELNKTMKKLNDNSNWQNRRDSAQRLSRYFCGLEREHGNAKIVSPVLYDFLGILKARIADPNKQLIKIFVSLVGDVFKCLSQKQAKIQSKAFTQDLIEALSDKNQPNRKQIYRTFDRISSTIGPETTINNFGQILSQESSASSQSGSITKQYAFEYLLSSAMFLGRVELIEGGNLREFREFPRIVLSGLCDKNRELRVVSQRMFRVLSQRTGIQVFRNFVNSKEQKLAFKGDLIAFLDKFQGLSPNEQPSMISNGSNLSVTNKDEGLGMKRSPSMNRANLGGKEDIQGADKSRRKLSNATSLCNSRSKGKNNSILAGEQNSKDFTSNLSFYLKDNAPAPKRIVQGSEPFAPLQILTAQRIAREQSSTKYRNAPNHPILEQHLLQSQISHLLHNTDLYQPMYSNDYTKNLLASQKISKLCRDVAHTNSIRQVSDLLLKWIVVKLYGGCVACLGLMEMVCPVLTVLEKRKCAWSQGDVQLLVFLMREFVVGVFFEGSENVEVFRNVFKLAIALSSGQRILRKILLQFKTEISQHHRHLAHSKRQGTTCNKFYKKILVQICGYFIDYFSNGDLLGQASTIPELSQDAEFVRLLGNKFHEGVLREFGFRLGEREGLANIGVNLEKSFINAEKNAINSPRNESPIAYFGGDKNKNDPKSKRVTPQKKNPNLNESQYPPPSPIIKTRAPVTSSISQPLRRQPLTMANLYKMLSIQPYPQRHEIDTSIFPQPSHHNPLSSNLLKLYPYNESTIHFFSTLFQPQNQSSDKIANQLSTHSNLIYSTLFNTLLKSLQLSTRQHQNPQKLTHLLSLIQQAIKCPSIYKNLNETLLERSIRFTVDQLVYEDENRGNIEMRLRARGYEFRGDVFVKGINGIMLRLLDFSYPGLLVNVLLFGMIQCVVEGREEGCYGGGVNRGKKMGLLIRCFNRVTSTYFSPAAQKQKQKQPQNLYNPDQDPSCLKPTHLHRFFLLLKQYLTLTQITDLVQFESKQLLKAEKQAPGPTTSTCTTSNNNNSEQSVILCLCKILRLLNKKNLLVKTYEQVKREREWNQRTIGDFVMAVSGVSMYSVDNYHVLANSGYQYQDIGYHGQNARVDDELRKILQLLSKSKTFGDGVKNLKYYIQQNGGKFDYKTVFTKMNFEQAFIQRVTEQLGKLNILSSQQTSVAGPARSLNPDIQNKLQRLKMKLEGINNEHSKSISGKMPPEEADRSTTTIRSHYPTLNLTTLALNGQKTQEIQTPRARELSTKSIDHGSSTTQNQLKKRIEEMKNKVSMSTSGTGPTPNTNKIR